MADPTETIRRERVNEINATPGSREALEKGSLEFQHSPRFYFNFQPH